MERAKPYIFKFLSRRLRDVFIIGLIISIVIFAFFGKNIFIQYIFGLLIGVLNFALLTIGIDLILRLNVVAARIVHFVFFALRYLAITIVIVLFIRHRDANVFIVVGGLLTMNLSIFAVEIKRNYF